MLKLNIISEKTRASVLCPHAITTKINKGICDQGVRWHSVGDDWNSCVGKRCSCFINIAPEEEPYAGYCGLNPAISAMIATGIVK